MAPRLIVIPGHSLVLVICPDNVIQSRFGWVPDYPIRSQCWITELEDFPDFQISEW